MSRLAYAVLIAQVAVLAIKLLGWTDIGWWWVWSPMLGALAFTVWGFATAAVAAFTFAHLVQRGKLEEFKKRKVH